MKIIRDDGKEYASPEAAATGLINRHESTFTLEGEDVTVHVRRVAQRMIDVARQRQDVGSTGLYQ